MHVREPTTMATDYLVALAGVLSAAALLRAEALTAGTTLWSCGLASLAVAAVSGGTFHGVGHVLGDRGRRALWKATTIAVGIAGSLMVVGTLVGGYSTTAAVVGAAVVGAELLAYVVWMLIRDEYGWVVLDSVAKLVTIGTLAAWRLASGGDAWTPWILGGVIVSFAAAAVQRSGVKLHRHLNHNDLYHVIQIVGVYLFYRGAALLVEAPL